MASVKVATVDCGYQWGIAVEWGGKRQGWRFKSPWVVRKYLDWAWQRKSQKTTS